jgi:hypothetical protein
LTREMSSTGAVLGGCALSVALVSTGCLAEPPTFEPRGQIPPFILAGRVEPPLGSVYEGEAPFSINVPFRSEDVGFDLQARLYLDLLPGAGSGAADVSVDLPAGIFEDQDRYVETNWIRSDAGCHSLTLILTYERNYGVRSALPLDDTRAARVVWWLNMGDADESVRMSTCPGASQDDSIAPSVP